MMQANNYQDHANDFDQLFSAFNSLSVDFSSILSDLVRLTNTPITSEAEVLERAEVMDEMIDIAKNKNSIVMLFVNAIADRIEEFENDMVMPAVPVPQRLRGLMEIKGVKQTDLKDVATQSVISEILSGKREVNLKQAKGFAQFFNLPVSMFIPA